MRPTKPSATACLIAASLACDYHDPARRELVPPLAAELGPSFLKAYGLPASPFAPFVGTRGMRFLGRCFETATIPGITLHYLLRKKFIEEALTDVLNQKHASQVVILGAGFDTLTLRLHSRYPEVQFIELDHPATQRVKLSALERNPPFGPNLHFLPSDFTQDTLESLLLKAAPYRADADTFFISEGVLMYLSEEEVKKPFSFIRNHSGSRSYFAFSFMEKGPDGKINFQTHSGLIDAWMALKGEPFIWGLERNDLSRFLEPLGFSLKTLGDAPVFRDRYLSQNHVTSPLAKGECIALVSRC